MYCKSCGSEIPDDAKFCPECGMAVESGFDDSSERLSGKKVTENIYLCPDGKYRWYYEFPMMKNPTLLFTIWKVLGISFGIVYLIIFLTSLGDYFRYGWDGVGKFWGGFLLLFLFFLVLGVVAYIILAWMYGWKYIVLFEMDENEIAHIQMLKQFKKAEAIGWLTALAGLASGNLTTIGIGINSAVRNSMTSEFKNVKEVRSLKRQHVIKVNQLLNHNQVYAEEADFDFVLEYITKHCVNAKIR